MPQPRLRTGALCRVVMAAVLGLGLATIPAGVAAGAPTPTYLDDATQQRGTFTSTNIGADRTSANFFYRIPALAHLDDGVVLAAWDGRPGSAADAPNPNSIVMRRSTDNGKTWSTPYVIAAGKVSDPKDGYSDPSLLVDRDTGRVFSFFVYSKDQGFGGSTYGNDDANRQVISSAVIHSDDGGLTWSEPQLITNVTKPANGTTSGGTYTPVAGDIRGNFATSGGGIQLRYGPYAGRLVKEYAGTVLQANGTVQMQAYTVYSDDHGASWHKGANVGTGMDENKVVELSDGRVMLNSRDSNNGHYRKVAISTDGGATFGPVTSDPQLPDPTNNAALIRMFPDATEGSADAHKLLFVNSNNGASGDRVNGAARVSCDDGQTWPGLRTIDSGFFAYASAAALDDGQYGVLWEKNYTDNIQFSTFDQAWLNYVCAPLNVPTQQLTPGQQANVPVTVTNQEAMALSGTVTFYTPGGWTAGQAQVTGLAPGASTTVTVPLTSPANATGTQRLQAAFTATDGRVSQFTATLKLPQSLGLAYTVTNTSAARDVVAHPYAVGDVLAFTVRVTASSDVATTVTPESANFTTGFLPTACRWQNLPANGAYNCTTPRRTLTQEDIDRGWFTPQFSFSIAPTSDLTSKTVVPYTGTTVVLRDGVLGATIVGSRADDGRELATSPYGVGDAVPYSFRVDSTSPVTTSVVPTEGDFAPFLPPGAGNCRYQNLAAFAGYTCGTPRHTVTQEDLDQGFFLARSVWTVSAAGLTTKTVTVDGGEVDVIARAPKLTGTVQGTWNDVNNNGTADAGDTVTWITSVTNTGNVALTGLTAGDVTGATLAVGQTSTVRTQTVALSAADLAAGHMDAPSTTATAANGSRSVTATATGPSLTLPIAPAWSASKAYNTGDRVTHGGRLWEALWWTQNQTPGASPYSAWQEIATDADGNTLWTASRVFDRGDRVIYQGKTFQAQWWTRNQAPGDPWGPWKELDR